MIGTEIWVRLVFNFILVVAIVYGGYILTRIAQQGEEAREARLDDLKLRAEGLSRHASELAHLVAEHEAQLVDCERCEIRKDWVALQSDQVVAAGVTQMMAAMAADRKVRRRREDRQENR